MIQSVTRTVRLLLHLRAERLLVIRCSRPLLLEKVNGERDFGTRASTYAEVLVTGLNHLARCLVVPRRVLGKQGTERFHRFSELLAGVGGTRLFLGECGIMQIAALVVVQREDVSDMTRTFRAESVPAGAAPDSGAFAAGG